MIYTHTHINTLTYGNGTNSVMTTGNQTPQH